MGRNLVEFKRIGDVISNSKVWRHYRHFDVPTTREVKSLHCFLVFGWIKLKFGVRGNFRLLISNLNSKTQYQFEILRKCHFSFLRLWFLAQHSLINWLLWQQWMTYLQCFNLKNFYKWLTKNDISLVEISWTVFEILSQNPQKPSTFSPVAFWWRHTINMMMMSSKIFVNL